MDNWLKSPWFIRVISLLMAVLLWTTVNLDDSNQSDALLINDGSEDVEVLNNVPVEVRYDEKSYTVSGVPQNVSVTLQGPNSVLAPVVRQKNFELYVDLEELGPGTHRVNIQHSGISNRLAVQLEPKTINVTIAERVKEEYPVSVDFTNEQELLENYNVGEPKVNPSEVTITGGEDLVDSVALVQAIVDVSGATETIENVEAPVKVYDSEGNELNVLVEPTTVQVKVPIETPSKTVPIEVKTTGEAPEGYAVKTVKPEVQEVTVFGPDQVLEKIEKIGNITVDVSDITETTTVEAEIHLPEGVKSVDKETVEVTVEMMKVENKEEAALKEIDIEVTNLPENQSIDFLNPEGQQIDITAIGEKEALADLTAEDITASIDVEGLEPGEHQVPISLSGPDNIALKSSSESATIRIG
ncbi:YbbR-like domain-containing protein [Thalassobacillus pellis]|uniref:CdaR family protein n=1 Tax=Thalassobacillus pellis TaxID=748008 RepID=UPI0019613D78|nr:CdaR family protein [Thalassobacillus pellis]MBM7554146.1 YbbR domain-containing protein [Thalassobacillus pellis]